MPTRSILLFVVAAFFEIGGAWLVWQGVREHKGWVWIGAGVIALGLYGLVATHQPDANFGRILAAYGGVFVAGSLAWGMIVDGFRPDPVGHRRRPRLPGRRGGHHVRATAGVSAGDHPTPCSTHQVVAGLCPMPAAGGHFRRVVTSSRSSWGSSHMEG